MQIQLLEKGMKEMITKIKNVIANITSKIGDKNMHILCSFIITFIVGLVSILGGIIIGCIISIIEELYSLFKYKKYNTGIGFSSSDLIYDAIGIVLAIILLIL